MNEVKFKANLKDLVAIQAAVSEIPEIPTPETTDEGKVLTVSVDSSGETPVAEYGLAAPASGLPAIGSGDAGKVLTVNAGETAAEWASAAGGNNTFIVTYTYDDSTSTCTADKTYQEIVAAKTAGKTIICKDIYTNNTFVNYSYLDIEQIIGFNDTKIYGFSEVSVGSGLVTYEYVNIIHAYDDSITYASGGGNISVTNAYEYNTDSNT